MPLLIMETHMTSSYEELGLLSQFTCTEYVLTGQAIQSML